MRVIPVFIVKIVMLLCVNSAAVAGDVEKGNRLFQKWCEACHGESGAATLLLEKRYQGRIPGALEKRTDLSRELITLRVTTQMPGMTPFRPTELSKKDVELLAEYLTRNNKR